MERIPSIIMAAIPGLIILRGVWKKCDVYKAFVQGAEAGMRSAVGTLPALAAMLFMLEMAQCSGLTELLVRLLTPLASLLGLPAEVSPLLVLRPLTGSGSLSALEGILTRWGADSRIGMTASVLMASTETVFYTLTVYLSAAGTKHLPHVVPVSLLSGLVGAWVCGHVL